MRKVLVLIMLLAAVLVSGQNADAATRWVSPNASGPAPGISCNNAGYATIQAAINAANAGDTVNVCPGSYIENITINKANLTVSSTGGYRCHHNQSGGDQQCRDRHGGQRNCCRLYSGALWVRSPNMISA